MMTALGFRLAAVAALGAAVVSASAQVSLPAAPRDDTSFRVPFPGKRHFSGDGSIVHLTLIGPVADTRIIGTEFDINFYTDGQTPASDLRVEVQAMVDGELRQFALRGSDLGFGDGPGMHRGTFSTDKLDGIVWQPDGFPHSLVEMVIETQSGGPIQGTAFFVGSAMTFTVIPADAEMTSEPFEDFTNEAGWMYGTGNEFIEAAGGNPDAFLHDPFVASAIPALSTAPGVASEFTGDYAAGGVVALGVDLKSFAISGGTPSEKLAILLVNDNGTPFDFTDDWGAYKVGDKPVPPVVAAPGNAGWFSYDFIVPSWSRSLPEGWERFGAPGAGGWSDLMRDVSGVYFYYGDPGMYHIFREWNVGADNPRVFRR